MAPQKHAVNEKQQFVLPPFPNNATSALRELVAQYLVGFKTPQKDQTDWWDASASAILAFVPLSLADLATKMIIAMHYRDPEIDGERLAIAAPGLVADRLAIEIELGNVDWAVSQAEAIARPADGAWDAAEHRLARACADLDALPVPYTDDEVDRLADLRSAAIDAVLEMPATTAAQAVRKLELAMFDEEMVRSGVDFPALLAEAKRLTGAYDAPPATMPEEAAGDAAAAMTETLATRRSLPGAIAIAPALGSTDTSPAVPALKGWRAVIAVWKAANAAVLANNAAGKRLRAEIGDVAYLERDNVLCRVSGEHLMALAAFPVEGIGELHEKATILADTWGTADSDVAESLIADIRRLASQGEA